MALKELLLTDTSPAAASTVAGANILSGLDQFDWFTIDAKLAGATGGVLDVYLQRFVASLNEWRDWIRFTQLAAGAAATRYVVDSSWGQSAIVAVGQGTSPVIAAATQVNLHPGQKVRFLFVAGASTSAGAAQSVVLSGWRKR